MKVLRLVLASLVLALAPALVAGDSDKKVFEKSLTFAGDRDIPIGVKHGDVTIKSVRVRHWPDGDAFAKAEKDLNDKHTAVIEFTYDNRDRDHDYKVKYLVTIPGKDGKPYGENDRTATLDKGKIDDTNKMFLKMYTNDYKVAKTMKVTIEIWRK